MKVLFGCPLYVPCACVFVGALLDNLAENNASGCRPGTSDAAAAIRGRPNQAAGEYG